MSESPITRDELREKIEHILVSTQQDGAGIAMGRKSTDGTPYKSRITEFTDLILQELDKAQHNCNQFGEDQPNDIHIHYFAKGVEAGKRELDKAVEGAKQQGYTEGSIVTKLESARHLKEYAEEKYNKANEMFEMYEQYGTTSNERGL